MDSRKDSPEEAKSYSALVKLSLYSKKTEIQFSLSRKENEVVGTLRVNGRTHPISQKIEAGMTDNIKTVIHGILESLTETEKSLPVDLTIKINLDNTTIRSTGLSEWTLKNNTNSYPEKFATVGIKIAAEIRMLDTLVPHPASQEVSYFHNLSK